MASVRPVRPIDLLKLATANPDYLTEAYNIGFYLEYLTRWPHLCRVIKGHDGKIGGYGMQYISSLFRCYMLMFCYPTASPPMSRRNTHTAPPLAAV